MVVAFISQNVEMTRAQFEAVGARMAKWKTRVLICPVRNKATVQLHGGSPRPQYIKPEFQPRLEPSGGEVVIFPCVAKGTNHLKCTNIILIVSEGHEDVRESAGFKRWASLVVDGSVFIVDPAGNVQEIEDERWQSIPDVERAKHVAYDQRTGLRRK